MLPKPRPKPRPKIRPFRTSSQISIRDPRFVYLENDRRNIKVPLQNKHGSLQGVFETANGKLVEIRYDNRCCFHAYVNGRDVGALSATLEHRQVSEDFQRQGIGTALFERGEPHLVGGLVDHPSSVRHDLRVRGKNTAAFLVNRGWEGMHPEDRAILSSLSGSHQSDEKLPKDVHVIKPVSGTKYDDAFAYHRILVLGKNGKAKGKPIWLTLKAVPATSSKK